MQTSLQHKCNFSQLSTSLNSLLNQHSSLVFLIYCLLAAPCRLLFCTNIVIISCTQKSEICNFILVPIVNTAYLDNLNRGWYTILSWPVLTKLYRSRNFQQIKKYICKCIKQSSWNTFSLSYKRLYLHTKKRANGCLVLSSRKINFLGRSKVYSSKLVCRLPQ